MRTLGRRLEQVEQELANADGQVPSNPEVADALGMTDDELHRLRERVFRSVVLALEHIVNTPDNGDLSLLDVLADRTAVEPSEELETRELLGYLRDAVDLLPDRHRIVIVGYFLQGRSSLELAHVLDVTESRISQLRSAGLQMLRQGIEAQFVSVSKPAPQGRAARRRADYAAAIGEASGWRDRLAGAA